MNTDRDGEQISSGGEWIGSIHRSQRSRKWFYKLGTYMSPARYYDADQAEDALREAAR